MQSSPLPDDRAIESPLFALLYEELHRIAQRELRRAGPAAVLSPTTLLHEAYLNLQQRDDALFPDRPHFLAYAARVMRSLIIDYMRQRQALKRGAHFEITSLPTDVPEAAASCVELTRLDSALERLEVTEPRLALLVNLKFFCGFSFTDIAVLWGISDRTVKREWRKARLFLHQCLAEPREHETEA